MENKVVPRFYEFDSFRLDGRKRVLLRAGEPVALTPRALDLLFALIERREQVVEKDELLSLLWPDSVVEENNLTVNVSALRKALGAGPGERRYVVTVPGRGYRFVADVVEAIEDVPALMRAAAPALVVEESKVRVVIEEEILDGVTEREGDGEKLKLQGSALESRPVAPSRHRPIAILALLGLLLAAGVYWWQLKESAIHNPQSVIKTLAVLPFKPLVAEGRDDYLQMGMADVLITRLSKLRQVAVRPLSAIRKYTALEQDALAAGRELKVDAVLDGHIQRAGERVRVTVRLVNVNDGVTLWAETLDEKFTDLFTVEDRLSEKLVAAFALNLSPAERQLLARRYTANSDAYQSYLQGRYFWGKWTKPSLEKAIEAFEQALKADPEYAPAHSGIADAWNLLGYLGFLPPREAFPKSEAAALRALQLDDTLGEAHLSLAKTKLFYDWDWPACEREINRALELSPNFADTHGMNGAYLLAMGRLDEALAARQRAQELDPTSPLFTTAVGWAYFYQRRYDQAIAWYRKALELDPNFALAYDDLSNALFLKGDAEQAVAEVLRFRTLTWESAAHLSALEQAFATEGKLGYWRKELELAEERAQQGAPLGAWRMARINAELGDRDQAFVWLNRAYEERASLLAFLKTVPLFGNLHTDPRFAELLRRIGHT
jgi:DNA-binding winged helix-turn-helix (wHTH) protein/TolB-like protein/Flp pilus assembly protein TadD